MTQRIEKVVSKGSIQTLSSAQTDLEYWLAKSPEDRIACVEILRRQYYGNSARLPRLARVVHKTRR